MDLRVTPADCLFFLVFVSAVISAAIVRRTAGLLLALAAALLCAGYAIFVDAHTGEVTATLLVIAGGAFLLGAAAPARPWRWAAIIGLAIPARVLLGALLGGPRFDLRIFITLALALAGAYAGAAARRAAAAISGGNPYTMVF